MAAAAMQQEIADGTVLTVKNTFLDIRQDEVCKEKPVRRSSSIPRTFKPCEFVCDAMLAKPDSCPAACSDASTSAASEKDIYDQQSLCSWEVGTSMDEPSGCFTPERPVFENHEIGRVKLSLCNLTEGQEKVKAKLRVQARPFTSVRTPPAEISTLLHSAVEVVSSVPGVADVKLQSAGMGGTASIMAQLSSPHADSQWLISMVKDALLSTAANSENTYVMGYGAQPFNTLDRDSFSARIAHVPAAHADTACWDTYEKGYCPRCATCRWAHPSDLDTMRLLVIIKRAC